MSEAHPILCSKCKKPGTADKSECASCHGRVVRKCGACGFTNSAAKKYCDACGENFSLVKPPPAPKPEAKAPPPPPKPEPKPVPKPEPKPEPQPAPKPVPQIKLEDIKLPAPRSDDAAPLELRPRMDTPAPRPIAPEDRAKAEPPKPAEPARPAPVLKPAEPAKPAEPPKPAAPLPPPDKPKDGRSAKDEAMERYLPKTVISRIPQRDKNPVERDDEPVPEGRDEKPEPLPEKAATPGDGPPGRKKDFLKMRLEGQTPPPEPLRAEPKPAPKPEAKPDPKAPPKAAPKEDKVPAEARKPGELDPRLIKGFERHEKDRPHAAAPPPKKVEGPSQTFIQRRPKAVLSTVVALVLLLTGFVAFFLKSKQKADPGDTLIKAAGDYLFTLKQKEFDKAYAMLSADSRRTAALGAFKALQDDGFWSFDDLGGEIVGPGWAVVRYKLLVPNQPVETDWLVMRFEEGRWTRAYWWPLMTGIEEALARGDHASAARLAREATAIDPLDPMPAAYYCEAAWMAGDASTALESCQKALKQSETLPSRIGNDGIFRARHLIADVHRHSLKRPADAAELYGQLLKYPRIEPAQACDLNLAKAEVDLELGRQDGALEAFRQAQAACRTESDAAFAASGVQVLSGQAGADAVAAVQSHRMPGDESTLAEWRTKSRLELSKRLKTRPQDLPAERWEASHKAGPVYVVVLKVGEGSALSAEVDLFSHKIKVDMNVQ